MAPWPLLLLLSSLLSASAHQLARINVSSSPGQSAANFAQSANADGNDSAGDLVMLKALLAAASDPSIVYGKLAESWPDSLQLEGEETLLRGWKSLQQRLQAGAAKALPALERKLRTLIVMPVGGSFETVDHFRLNLVNLKHEESAGDVFHFALFHYVDNAAWLGRFFYSEDRMVLKRTKAGCKAEFWMEITEDMAKDYDYLWLMDDDLSLSTFSWPLYRQVLLALEPLVSQPAILGSDAGQRSSDYPFLRMAGLGADGSFSIAREVPRTEVQAPILSSKLWPAFLERLRSSDRRSAWFLSDFWDIVALTAKEACGKTGPLVVDASPVRHLNKHNLLAPGSIGARNHCTYGCGASQANCAPISEGEEAAVANALQGFCRFGETAFSCKEEIRNCLLSQGNATNKKSWSLHL